MVYLMLLIASQFIFNESITKLIGSFKHHSHADGFSLTYSHHAYIYSYSWNLASTMTVSPQNASLHFVNEDI